MRMRSWSRLEYYDFGVNRERLESIRAALRSENWLGNATRAV